MPSSPLSMPGDRSGPDRAHLGAEHQLGDGSAAVARPPPELTRHLTHSDNDLLDAALRLVTVLAAATITGADGASVSLHRGGRMATVASSDATVLRMDQHQYQTGEGPCLTAAAEGDWIHVESLLAETRWPRFIPLAVDEGIASILSTPLLAADRPRGALNVYSNTTQAFGPKQQELAALFATQASGILADALDLAAQQPGQEMQEALRDREVIAQAQGVLMARRHLTEDEAVAVLHRTARDRMVSVARRAAGIVASTELDVDGEPRGRADG